MNTVRIRPRLSLEQLEDRANPAPMVFIVSDPTGWDDGTKHTLPWAVKQANLNPGADTISVAVSVAAGGGPGLRITEAVGIIGGVPLPNGGIGPSTISGVKGHAVFTFDGPDPTAHSTIGLIRFENNNSKAQSTAPDPDSDGLGGAIRVMRGAVEVVDSEFINNKATHGGAVLVEPSATIEIRNSTALNNQAEQGGLIHSTCANVEVVDTVATSNKALLGHGGAIWAHSGTLAVYGGTFQYNNAANIGGAIYAEFVSDVNLQGVWFKLNSADDAGGALAFENSGAHLDNVWLNSNTTSEQGGAIYASNVLTARRTLYIANSWFGANEALDENSQGGGLYLKNMDAVIDSTFFSSNRASQGQAIFIDPTSNLALFDCDFFDNTVKNNGGWVFWDTDTTGLIFE